MDFKDFKKKYKDLLLSEEELKDLYYMVSISVLSRIYPNENDHYLITGEDAEAYYDYLVQGYKLASEFYKFKFSKKFYEAFNFMIINSQNFHYTVLFNELNKDLKIKIMDLLFANRKKFKMPNLIRFFLVDMVFSNDPEKFLKIEPYKSFVASNGKYLFD